MFFPTIWCEPKECLLFCLYINDLDLQIKASSLGFKIDDQTEGILLYVDDGFTERNLQIMLTIVSVWCWKWRLVVNQDKTHFRQKSLEQSSVVLNFGSTVQSYTDHYKYLGLMLDEHMTCKTSVSDLILVFPKYTSCNTVHHRAIQSFLRIHNFTSVLAISGDMGSSKHQA